MKNMCKRIVIGLLAVSMVFLGVSSAAAVSLFFNPIETETELDSLFSVDIAISGLQTEDLSAFRFNITFDDAILDFESYTLYDGLGDIAAEDAEGYSQGYLSDGVVNLSELSLLSNLNFQENSFTLATLTFNASGVGSTDLAFSSVKLADYWGDSLDAAVGTGSVTVAGNAAVPEPATWLLLGVGFIGVWGVRKKIGK